MLLRFVQWVSECDNLLNEPAYFCEMILLSISLLDLSSSTLVTFRLLGAGLPINANAALDGVYTGWAFTNNGIVRSGGQPSNFPLGNLFEPAWTSLFVNFNNGLDGWLLLSK